MLFDDGSTASLTMIAFTKAQCARRTKIYGTKGELEWDDLISHDTINHFDFLTRQTNVISCSNARPNNARDPEPTSTNTTQKNKHILLSGHGGSDYWLIDLFVEAVLRNDKSLILTDVEDSLRSHLVVFAAEHSRVSGKVVDVDEFCKENNISLKHD